MPHPSHPRSSSVPPTVSVVVPHMGRDRLPHLAAALKGLRACAGVDEVVVCETGGEPVAGRVAEAWADRYVFVRHDGPFERARALNVGIGLAACELVLWMDNDILLPPGFVARAARELCERGLDHLVPFSTIRYLSEDDSREVMDGRRGAAECRPAHVLYTGGRGPDPAGGTLGLTRRDFIQRYGGLVEGFRGWGGEDNAWVAKVRLLGRSGVTEHPDQHVHHLYHPGSGGYPDGRPAERNPHYAENVALMQRVFAMRDAGQFLREFPPPARWPCPWPPGRRIVFASGGEAAGWAAFAREVARELEATHGSAVEETRVPAENGARERWAAADALVAFGRDAARALQEGVAGDAARRLVVVTGPADGPDAVRAAPAARLSLADGEAAGRASLRLIGPLSLVLGAGEPAPRAAVRQEPPPVWLYWEGACPEWIRRCQATLVAHAPGARLLTPEAFDALRDRDRDVDLRHLQPAHRADYVRAFLLARHGGLWIDSDCVAMRPLAPVLELVRDHDFVGHRERSEMVSNGFMGARPGSPVAAELYERICRILRSRRPFGWTSLGGDLLTEILDSGTAAWHELPCEAIQPVCWRDQAAFFALGDAAAHERAFDPRALCYMLSNSEVRRYQPTVPHSLEHPDSFFSFVVSRSLAGAPGRPRLEDLPP